MIAEQIVLFEDVHAHSRLFKPLAYTRCVAELLCGAYTGIERIKTFAGPEARIVLHVRPALAAVIKKRYENIFVNELVDARRTIFINARFLVTEHFYKLFFKEENTVFRLEEKPEELVAFHIGGEIAIPVMDRIIAGEPIAAEHVKLTDHPLPKAKLFSSLWNMVNSNPVVIESDIKRIAASKTLKFQSNVKTKPKVDTESSRSMFIDPSVNLSRRIFLDASAGPIRIEENVTFEPHVTVMGPCVIRAGSLIKAGAKIHPGTTIGPVSKIGGEIENSIIQGYSNKQHDGYLGHSFIGEWCNLGAGTNTSDLRNDYSNVKVTIEDEEFETKSLFVGLLMGDHSKTAIGTQFNTGTAVGVSSNIFCTGFPPKWLPNFSWCGPGGLEKYKQEKALEVAKIVMARRGKKLGEEEEAVLRSLG